MYDYTDDDLKNLLGEKKPSLSFYIKGLFILLIVGGGIIFMNFFAKQAVPAKKTSSASETSKTLDSITYSKDKIVENTNVDNLAKNIDIKNMDKSIKSISENVQGEATRAAYEAIDKTTNSAVDYVYDNTVLKVIKEMVNRLPERQRENFKNEFCAQ